MSETTTRRYLPGDVTDRIAKGERQWGDKFSPASLLECDDSILAAYQHGSRVRVVTTYDNGEMFTRTGVVSTTTGWVPAFILMHRSNAMGSWDVLGPRDRVVAIWNGRKYV